MKTRKRVYAEPVPKGMFVFSKPMEYEEELNGWKEHFRKKGISTAVIRDYSGRFYLCREGKEKGSYVCLS